MQLHEKHRPRQWSDVVGQAKAIERIDAVRKRGLGGRTYFLSGASGTGKTTIARLLAAELADDWFITESDAEEITPARLHDWESAMHLTALGKGGRAFIVNEAHGLRRDTIRKLLVLLEDLPDHVVVIFTTTRDGQAALFENCDDSAALLSRCIEIRLTNQGLSQVFAKRCQMIAQTESIDGHPIAEYVKLAKRCGNNLRKMLQLIDAGDMGR